MEDEKPAKVPRKKPKCKPNKITNTFEKINGCIKLIRTIDLGLQKSTRKSNFKPNLTRKTAAVEIIEEKAILNSNLTPRRKFLERNFEKKRKEIKEQETLNDFRKNLKKVTNQPKMVPDNEKLKRSHIESRKIKKQEDKEDKEGRKKSITPRSDSEEGAGASENLKWPKSTKNLVNYFKNLENSVQSGESI